MLSSMFFSDAFYDYMDNKSKAERIVATVLATCVRTIAVFQAPLLLVMAYFYPISQNDDIGYTLAKVSIYLSCFVMTLIANLVAKPEKALTEELSFDSYEGMPAEYNEHISFQGGHLSSGVAYSEFAMAMLLSDNESDC